MPKLRYTWRGWLASLSATLALVAPGCFARQYSRPTCAHTVVRDAASFRNAVETRLNRPLLQSDIAELELFQEALCATVNAYVDPVDLDRLMNGAVTSLDSLPVTSNTGEIVRTGIDAMMASLEQSAYLAPDLYQDIQGVMSGARGGVGLEFTVRDRVITVVSPIEDSPAARAGIQPNDQLITISGRRIEGQRLVQVVHSLRGPVGTVLELTVHRPASNDDLAFSLTREIVAIKGVTSSRVRDRLAYIRISQFNERSATDLDRVLESFAGESLDGLVFDLRANPGGLFKGAVKVADVFLPGGLIVSTRGRLREQNHDYYAHTKNSRWSEIPMIVLVDHGTGAGSEIVAAALQSHRRARVVGAKTFGLGAIQTILPIGSNAALRLKTARAISPGGLPIDLGVEPDVPFDASPAGARPAVDDPVVGAAVNLLSNPALD